MSGDPSSSGKVRTGRSEPGFEFIEGGGKMAKLVREKDWSKTSLGPVEQWPQILKTSLSICLQSRFPTALYWGPDRLVLYNDAWSPIPGDKHPWAFGRPGREVWSELWSVLEPMFDDIMKTGKGVVAQDGLLPMLRRGFLEECYFDYNCSAIRDENGEIVGIFNVASEVTQRLIAERRTRLLKDLAESTARVDTADQVCASAAEILARNSKDVPFSLMYIFENEGREAHLTAHSGIAADHKAAPAKVDMITGEYDVWDLRDVWKTSKGGVRSDLESFTDTLPGGPWPEPTHTAVVVPLRNPRRHELYGALIAGISPRLAIDDGYKAFLKRVAAQIAAAKGEALEKTERARLVQREREAQEQLGLALSIGSVGTWLWNVTENVLTADANLARLFGIDPQQAQIGLPLEAFTNAIHPADRDRIVATIADTLRAEGSFEEEYRTVDADGKQSWVIARGKVEKKGGIVRFPGLLVDITDRKLAEEQARLAAAELTFMSESMPQKIFVTEPDGTSRYLNRQWSEYTGLSLEQIAHSDWQELLHPEDRAASAKTWSKSLKIGVPFEIEQRFRDANGAYRWHLTRARPMYDEAGDVVKWIGSSTDISDQKQLELNLAFLAEASKLLAMSADYQKNFKKVAKLMVPKVADWCVVDLYEGDNVWNEVVLMHKDPQKIALARKLRQLLPPDIQAATGVPAVVRTGTYEYTPEITEDMFEATIPDKKVLELVRQVGFSSIIIVPLLADSKPIGALTIVSAEQKRHFTKSDLEMAQELAAHMAQAVSNARYVESIRLQLKQLKALEAKLIKANERLELRVKQRTRELEKLNQGLEREISRRKEVEQTLYVEREFLRAVLSNIDTGVVACDADGVLTFFNRATRELHGLPARSIPSSEWAKYYSLYMPDGKTPMRPSDVPLYRALNGEIVEEETIVVVPKKGEPRTLLASGRMMTGVNGEKTGAVVVMQDITELKKSEKSLQEYSAELARSNGELENFAYVASHDLQEPLRKIQAFGDLLQEEYADKLGEGKDYLLRMNNAASRMSVLIEDLLEFSRVATKGRAFVPTDLSTVANEVASDLEVALMRTNGTLKIGKLPTIDADPIQMRQLLQNLISNALKFHKPDAPPAVSVTAKKVKMEDGRDAVALMVSDNGIGFDEKYADRIFSVFQRLHSRGDYDGTGIGLAVCRKIVERHGGTIEAASTIGEGSVFTVVIPLKHT